jgi:hypothetical protein
VRATLSTLMHSDVNRMWTALLKPDSLALLAGS